MTAELIVTPAQAQFLWWLSWLTLGSGVYAGGRCGAWGLSALMTGTFLTSINYWRLPVAGLRRQMDVTMVRANLAGHLLAGAMAGGPAAYFVLTAIALSCYGVGVRVHREGQHRWWESVLWHSGLHVIGNLAHILLYNSISLVSADRYSLAVKTGGDT
jgi:hypothetical protein